MTHEALLLLHRIIGLNVMCTDSRRVGRVDDILLGPLTTTAEWIAVRSSQFSRRITPIPLDDARVDGMDVRTPYSSGEVRGAPTYRAHQSLTVGDEQRLHDYWSDRGLSPT